MNKLEKLLTKLSYAQSVSEKCQTDELRKDLQSQLTALLKEKMETSPSEIQELVEGILEAEGLEKIDGDIKGWSDVATNIFGEWNKEAAQMTVLGVIGSGGSINLESKDRVLSFGELLGLEESSPVYNHPSGVTVSQKVSNETFEFCSNSSVVEDWLKTPGPWESGEVGLVVSKNESGSVARVVVSTSLNDEESLWKEELMHLGFTEQEIEDAGVYLELHKSGEPTVELLERILAVTTKLPLVVTEEKLAGLYVTQESNNEYLAPLVGLVRSLKVSKEEFDRINSIYSTLGNSALKSLLNKAFETAKVPDPAVTQESDVDHSTDSEADSTPDELYDSFGRILSSKVSGPTHKRKGK